MLEEHGYGVVEAEDGKSALGKLSSPGVSIDVALTDVVMRGMSGPELALELMQRYPAIRVVYMSGYTGELIVQNGDSMHGMALLDKPFTRAMLLKTLYEALR
jgi:CheY-like chemotaxis protein